LRRDFAAGSSSSTSASGTSDDGAGMGEGIGFIYCSATGSLSAGAIERNFPLVVKVVDINKITNAWPLIVSNMTPIDMTGN
jgi:hypothetical protein